MRRQILALVFIGTLTVLAAVLLAMGRTDYEVSFDAVLEIWADVVRDADHIGLTVTRVSAEREMEVGAEIERQMDWAPRDTKAQRYVEAVGKSLVEHTRRRGIEYRFYVVQAPFINAFAIPGGGIFITTRMLAFLETEAELAWVLGHEIAHVDLRHCIERLQYELFARKVVGDLATLVSLARELLLVGFSEQQEHEADAHGVLLATKAGYDPLAGLSASERLVKQVAEEKRRLAEEKPTLMSEEIAGALWEALKQYFETHPPWAGRARELTALYNRNEAVWLGRKYYVGSSNYEDRVARTTEERQDQWAEYTESPELIECILASGIMIPTRPEGCPQLSDREAVIALARYSRETGALRALAERGDTDAAILLATEFGELEPLRKLAEQGDRQATFELAKRFDEPGALRKRAEQGDTDAAMLLATEFGELEPLRKLAEQGDRQATLELAKRSDEPGPLRKLAEEGDSEAAAILAHRFGELGPLRALAESGDFTAQRAMFDLSETGSVEERMWLCKLAEQGGGTEWAKVANYLENGTPTSAPDLVQAYVWYVAAENTGHLSGSGYIRTEGGWACCYPKARSASLLHKLTAKQIEQANQLLEQWSPSQCPWSS